MTRQIPSSMGRAAVVLLALSVVLCLVLPMSGDGQAGMHFAMLCCFVLAVALSVFLLARPQRTLLLGGAARSRLPLARAPTRFARPPDPVALGALLI